MDSSVTTLMAQRRPTDVPVLLPVGGLAGREINLDAFLHSIVDRVKDHMRADRGTLYLVDPVRQELFSRAAHLPELKQIRLKLGQGVAGVAAEKSQLINIPTTQAEGRFHGGIDKLTGYTTTSLLAVPLIDEVGETFGVLQVLNKKGGARFDADDEERFTAIAKEVSQTLQATSLYTELRRAKQAPTQPVAYFFNNVIGESNAMRSLYKSIEKAAKSEATVLLRGESGTGKELFARAVHVNSPRRQKPLVKVDCAALPASLIENELFGHEKGAFTGAESRQLGKFEMANGGTVFLDEIGELPLAVQGKLLRVLQDRELERVGGTATVKVDVRIVAATHRDLAAMVKAGTFREDLLYRIRVVELVLPPLRVRGKDDIERLARHFLAGATKRHHLSVEPTLGSAALSRLQSWTWPGNVRELEHCIESAVVLCDGEIRPEHLSLPETAGPHFEPPTAGQSERFISLAEAERRHIERAIELSEGNRSKAAAMLGIGRNTLIRKLREYSR